MSTYICFLLIKKNWSHIDDQLLKLLPIIRRIKTENYYHDSDKLLSLYSTLLLSYMLEDYYHIDNALHNIVWENNKKPILKGFPNIDFSYSHTKGAILCGITKNSSIGVDIELANTPPYEIMPLVFHPNEICYVNNSLRSKKQAFYKIWTQKEAFTKRKGTGLSGDIISIDTQALQSTPLKTWTQNKYICSISQDNFSKINYLDISLSQIIEHYLQT